LLHLGHARTFWTAAQRAWENRGTLILRNEDLDLPRCRPEFVQAMIEDLRWLGIHWDEGPDIGGPHAPYSQSQRRSFYLRAWEQLRAQGFIYPCICSRKDVAQSAAAPNDGDGDGDDEPIYNGHCRSRTDLMSRDVPAGVNWRFRVPDGEAIRFLDGNMGPQSFVAGQDFGDFLVWRRDDIPSYQLAVVVDDAEMQITEVVRGADLLKSAARQILLFRALGWPMPGYYHCQLVRDRAGIRLAKRHDALSLRRLRRSGYPPERVLTDLNLVQ
jgi:glutamyl-tRNA synthetase